MKYLIIAFFLFSSCAPDLKIYPKFIIRSKEITVQSPKATYNVQSGRYEIIFTVTNNTSHVLNDGYFTYGFYTFNNMELASLSDNVYLNLKPHASRVISFAAYFADIERPEKIYISY